MTRSEATHEWPTLTHSHRVKTDKGILKRPLNDLETSLLVGEENRRQGDQPVDHASIDYIRNTVKTHQHLVRYRRRRNAPQWNLMGKLVPFWLRLRLNVVAPIVQWYADRIDALRS
ncbi:MAG: hypothetical protein R2932_06750 [Caldilineaceae bacterium]